MAASIWAELERGETDLKNSVTRINIDESLRRNRILQNAQDFDARTLMKEFFKAFMRDWPSHTTIEYVEPYLEALRNMRNVINVTEVNEHARAVNRKEAVSRPEFKPARHIESLCFHHASPGARGATRPTSELNWWTDFPRVAHPSQPWAAG